MTSSSTDTNSDKNKVPKITIGLMVRNEEEHLAKTLDSILEQSFADYEILIADNASDDGTKQIAEKYIRIEKRIKYHRQIKNIGAIENYNWLVRNARGCYFVLAGAHDIWPLNYLESLSAALDSDENAVLAYAPTIWIDEEDNPVKEKKTGFIDTSGRSIVQRFNMMIWTDQHALYGVFRLGTLQDTRLQLQILGSGAVLLAELSLTGTFIVVPETNWYRRMVRDTESREQRLSRYAKALFTTGKMPKFPHWRVPLAYYGAVLRAKTGLVNKVALFLSVSNVFLEFGSSFVMDVKDAIKSLFSK